MYVLNKHLRTRYTWGQVLLFTMLVALSSCKKQPLSELDNIAAQLSGDIVTYHQKANFVRLLGKSYNFSTAHIGVPVLLQRVTQETDTIYAQVDPSLVAAYNQMYDEQQPDLPDDAFRTSAGGKFFVETNRDIAQDSLYIVLHDGSQLQFGRSYLVPVRLASAKGNKLKYSVIFFKITVTPYDLSVQVKGGSSFNNTPPFNSWGKLFFSYYVGRDPEGTMLGPDEISINVAINTPFPVHDLAVGAEFVADEASILEVGSYYSPFPENTYRFSKQEVQVNKGNLLSTDSLKVNIRNKAAFEPYVNYLLGVRLKQVDDPQRAVPPATGDAAMAYIGLFVY